MTRITKVILGIVLILVVVLAGGYIYFQASFPKVGSPLEVTVESTPELVDQGEYLANNVAVCIDCHSQRNFRYFSGPIVPGTEGHGGDVFNEEMGVPGEIYAKNITPKSLGAWTDGEIIRTITTGVSRDGTALFPIMPYRAYRYMATEDVRAIVAYIRSLEPGGDIQYPERRLNFPLNLLVNTIPQEAAPKTKPEPQDTLAYGEYLTNIAACKDCHTPSEKGNFIEGMEFAGGMEFKFPSGAIVRSMNITSDTETGVGDWSKEQFIAKFKMYESPDAHRMEVPKDGMNTVMPWTMYAGMTEQDLGAIYEYLQTVKPVKNEVLRFSAASR
ncbi:MAG: c-type cytochrome [Candidatus Marinimicrobia bacterium]|nr:c-type cytochrome [Candidatus Neomarinimicrobiota bacterium]MCF7828656.1 c-type cytochrome [Candidatus Neomarinimicrobiota bacterium]MCF7880397.1 c-type cytochrome [Candidatus Neomarinimicrobiota bacterium]